jgi:hypothetical protein
MAVQSTPQTDRADGPSGPPTLTKPSDILSAAADLIEPEGRWTQKQCGRGASGRPVNFVSKATCFCAVGAIAAAAGAVKFDDGDGAPDEVVNALRVEVNCWHIPTWNDAPNRTQSEVVTALRQAAEKAREQGQ